jgi:hypothetical protein
MAMLLHAINQAALVKSTDNSGNSCNMRVNPHIAIVRVMRNGYRLRQHYIPGCG